MRNPSTAHDGFRKGSTHPTTPRQIFSHRFEPRETCARAPGSWHCYFIVFNNSHVFGLRPFGETRTRLGHWHAGGVDEKSTDDPMYRKLASCVPTPATY